MSKSLLNSKTAPHLLLGIESDAHSSDAIVGFTRASKRVKTSESALFTIEDLTSALSEFEALDHAQEFGLRYAVPANPSVFDVEASFVYKKAVLKQSDDLTVVLIKDISEEQKETAGRTFLSSSVNSLLQPMITSVCAAQTLRRLKLSPNTFDTCSKNIQQNFPCFQI